jgi:RecB family exonuclease
MRLLPDPPDAVASEVHQLLLSQLPRPEGLEGMQRAEPVLHATYRDLHDAGFAEGHLEAAAELLHEDPWWERGQSLLRGYITWRRAAEALELYDRSDLVRQAIRGLELGASSNPGAPSNTEHLFWYGIYDLTGVMADLVRLLCRTVPGRFYFPSFADTRTDTPVPETPDQYLRDVFESVVAPVITQRIVVPDAPRSPTVERVHASGERGELEAVARRISIWADGFEGEPPWSRVAVVARDVSGYIAAARRIFLRYRIPIVTPRGAPARLHGRIRGLLAVCDLVRDGLRRDRFMDAIALGGPAARAGYAGMRGPVDAALRQFGIVGHNDWPALVHHLQSGRSLLMPTRIPDPSDQRPRKQELPPEVAEHLCQHVGACLKAIDDWPLQASASEHAAHWRTMVQAVHGQVDAAADTAANALEPTPGEVTRTAFIDALQRRIEAGRVPEERGDGVLFGDVMSARGMSFSRMYLVGLNRRKWPRTIHEDPLIPDRVRRLLRSTLGLDALPVKERGHAEEALLFRIAADAPDELLVLGHQRSDSSGKALVQSPFVDAMEPRIHAVHAIPRRRLDAILPYVRDGISAGLSPADLAFYSASRHRGDAAPALMRLSTDKVRQVMLAAGLQTMVRRDDIGGLPNDRDGLIGPIPARNRPLAPTRVEELLRCPWQAFVRRLLHVDPPDAIGDIPTIDPLRRGIVVHAVHERLVAWLAGVEFPGDLLLWADAEELCLNWAQLELSRSLEDEPTMAPLIQAVLWPGIEERIQALVATMRDNLNHDRIPHTAEQTLNGSVILHDGRPISLTARADRMDKHGDGHMYADVKTGKPPADTTALLKQMSQGRKMQAAFYHWLGDGPTWAGYEHLYEGGAHKRVGLTDQEFQLAEPGLKEILGAAVDLRQGGRFVLRRGRHCDWCDVTATCTRQHRPATLRLERLDESEITELDGDGLVIKRYRRIATKGADLSGKS